MTRTSFVTSRATRGTSLAVALVLFCSPAAIAADGPLAGGPLEPTDSPASIAQSMQLRVDASGQPNANRVDFRWSVTQVSIPGPDIPAMVTIPEEGAMLHSLLSFDYPQENPEDGTAVVPVSNKGSYGIARTVSLVPQDFEVPVEVKAEFTLDGEPITPEDLVGRDGVVTAEYTVKNLTGTEYEVPITTLTGKKETRTVTAQTPMVVQAETYLPQRFTDLNTGVGLGGADGRGNTQVVWIGLPFQPLSKSGTAKFGWAANVTDAVVPAMVVQALPVYLPNRGDRDGSGLGGPSIATPGKPGLPGLPGRPDVGLQVKNPFPPVVPPDVSPGTAQVAQGVGNVIRGLKGFANSGNGADPLDKLETGVNDFFEKLGIKLEDLSAVVGVLPPKLDKAIRDIQAAQDKLTVLDARLARLNALLTPQRINQLQELADNWPKIAKAIQKANNSIPKVISFLENPKLQDEIDCSLPNPAVGTPPQGMVSVGKVNKTSLVERGGTYKGFVDKQKDLPANPQISDAYTFGGGLTHGGAIFKKPDPDSPAQWDFSKTLPSNASACRTTLLTGNQVIPTLPTVIDLTDKLTELQPLVAELAAIPALSPENADEVQQLLLVVSRQLPGILTVITPLTKELTKTLTPLEKNLAKAEVGVLDLQRQLGIYGDRAARTQIRVPALNAIVSNVVQKALSSPNGQLVTSGLDETVGGVGIVKTQLAQFVTSLAVSLKTGATAIKGTAGRKIAGLKVKIAAVKRKIAGASGAAKVKLLGVKRKLQGALGSAKAKAGAAGEKVNGLKASVGGMLQASHQSPLPYGGDPQDAPPGTQLAGAYEFAMDAADTEAPSTDMRVIIGLIALLGAGGLGAWAARRGVGSARS